MAQNMLAALALVGAVAVTGLPKTAVAVDSSASRPAPIALQPGVTYHYNYAIFRADGIGFEHVGTLALRFGNGGMISGYSGFDFDFPTIPVFGGRSDGKFWLDIGPGAIPALHVEGTIDADGSLHAYGFSMRRSNAIYTFTARLQ